MFLDVLKSSVSFSKWRESPGRTHLSFEVVPQDGAYIDIGDDYAFCSNRYSRLRVYERQLIRAVVTVYSDDDFLQNVRSQFSEDEQQICGFAAFYPERDGGLETTPSLLSLNVVVEPQMFADMLQMVQARSGAAVLNVSIEALEYGYAPDGSHQIWKLGEGRNLKPISSFSYGLERFWTTENAISDENDEKLNATLADSPNSEDKKLAKTFLADKKPDETTALLKQCRSLLVAVVILGAVALFKLSA